MIIETTFSRCTITWKHVSVRIIYLFKSKIKLKNIPSKTCVLANLIFVLSIHTFKMKSLQYEFVIVNFQDNLYLTAS